ncbi:MAG: bifunctional diguanylate cyclase/phosphodiesterase [Acidimicrobiia bacterium]|nr:bifunctional diguanylate cyclase/phosphodiesterase [Acidimicrobiia bacterium]
MVDRQQEQARLALERMGADGRAGHDLSWIVVTCIIVTTAAILTGAAAALLGWLDDVGSPASDALLVSLIVVPIASTFYAVRRYRDAAAAGELLAELSMHDSLTGLPNRRFLGDGFEDMLQQARRTSARVAVFFVDLDGFKQINDQHGHEVGDRVMVEMADRLTGILGQDDVVVRYGGDEFVVLVPDTAGRTSAERRARDIIRAVESPIDLDGLEVSLSASVGIALSELRCTRPGEVLRDADAAMYRAKAAGPGRYALFDRGASDRFTPSTADRRLRAALERGEFRLYYQPIVSLWTKRLVGAEALLRWKDPDAGMVSPDEFMPALEETGLIVPIGDWVFSEVVRQSTKWQQQFPDRPALNVKVNVSARQLAQADFCERLDKALAAGQGSADRLCLEVAETAIGVDVHTAWSTLRDAKASGVTLALADFGTGQSSMSYLRQLSFDLLTIDRSFVDGIGLSREDTTIIEHIIGLAKALGIVSVAQGVENEAQVEQLRALNCDLAQGYYFSHPQPPDVITRLLAADGNAMEWRPPTEDEAADADDSAVVLADRFST